MSLQASETGGAQAEYSSPDGSQSVRRDIFGWDAHGRPLVMCGGRLATAAEATYVKYPKFVRVVKPDFTAEIRAAVGERIAALYDPVHDAVHSVLSSAHRGATATTEETSSRTRSIHSSGIRPEHFNKPLLLPVLRLVARQAPDEQAEVMCPVVDYIALDPHTGSFTEVRGSTIRQKNIRDELITCFHRGDQAVTGVATHVPGAYDSTVKVLRALDDTNSAFGVKQATDYLLSAAVSEFVWWPGRRF